MTDGPALVSAIEANPGDDLPRLMWADWLDDHGQPERAEVIRADLAPEPSVERQRAALDALAAVWPADLEHHWKFDGPLDELSLRTHFRRGCLTGLEFHAHGDTGDALNRFAGREPLVCVILCADATPAHVRRADGPHLARVLLLYGRNMSALLGSPHLTGLRAVTANTLTDLRKLRKAAAGANLHTLTVTDADPVAAAELLADEPRFASLRRLVLSWAPTDGRALAALIDSLHLSPELELTLPAGWKLRRGSRLGRALAERFPGPEGES